MPEYDVEWRRRPDGLITYYPRTDGARKEFCKFIPNFDGGYGFLDTEPDAAWLRRRNLILAEKEMP